MTVFSSYPEQNENCTILNNFGNFQIIIIISVSICSISINIMWNLDSLAIFLVPHVQEVNTAERHICLTRDVQTNLSLNMETSVSKVTMSL